MIFRSLTGGGSHGLFRHRRDRLHRQAPRQEAARPPGQHGAFPHPLLDPEKLEALYAFWGVDKSRAIPVVGDLKDPHLGVAKAEQKKLKGKIDHFFHLAALYDLGASAEEDEAVNIAGTRHTLALAEAIAAAASTT
jgi:nucleoside-diphosphate-sugar epimerase